MTDTEWFRPCPRCGEYPGHDKHVARADHPFDGDLPGHVPSGPWPCCSHCGMGGGVCLTLNRHAYRCNGHDDWHHYQAEGDLPARPIIAKHYGEDVAERLCGPEMAEDDGHAACEWCGRAIYSPLGSRDWLAVKGVERGYDPLYCDANDEDGRHEPPENNPSGLPEKAEVHCSCCDGEPPCPDDCSLPPENADPSEEAQ